MRYPRTERLKLRLRRLGYTQQELADAICYSRSYVTAALNGSRGTRCLEAITEQIEIWEEQETENRETENWKKKNRKKEGQA